MEYFIEINFKFVFKYRIYSKKEYLVNFCFSKIISYQPENIMLIL